MAPIVGFVQPFFYFIKFLSIATISCSLSLTHTVSLSHTHTHILPLSHRLLPHMSEMFSSNKTNFHTCAPGSIFVSLACSLSLTPFKQTHTHTHTLSHFTHTHSLPAKAQRVLGENLSSELCRWIKNSAIGSPSIEGQVKKFSRWGKNPLK